MKLSSSSCGFRNVSNYCVDQIYCYEGTGFKYLNLSLNDDRSQLSREGEEWRRMVNDVGEAAAKMGIGLIMAHAPYTDPESYFNDRDSFIRSIERCIEGCALLGIKDLVVHGSPYRSNLNKQQFFDEINELYHLILPAAEKYGINILLENFYEHPLLSNGQDLLELHRLINHPLVYVCWDTGHAGVQKVDQYESIISLGKKLRGLHISDNDGKWDWHTGPFIGDINFDPVMQALADIDYSGYFNFEVVRIFMPEREPWVYHGHPVNRLTVPPKHLSQMAFKLLYEIGVYMLTSYGVFEE